MPRTGCVFPQAFLVAWLVRERICARRPWRHWMLKSDEQVFAELNIFLKDTESHGLKRTARSFRFGVSCCSGGVFRGRLFQGFILRCEVSPRRVLGFCLF